MDKNKDDKEMIIQNQKATTDTTMMNLAKKGMKKYRKMLDKLSKN